MPTDAATLMDLRRRITALERSRSGTSSGGAVSLGVAEIDAHLPWGGLPLGCVHELRGAATAFAATLAARFAARRHRPVFWIAPPGRGGRLPDLYAPGLATFGLSAAALIVVSARGATALWAMEEALRAPAAGAVVAEIEALNLTASRRLQLAAEAGGAGGLLLRGGTAPAASAPPLATTACVTRWRVAPLPSAPFTAAARWQLTLERCRGGRPGAWSVEWNDATGDLTMAAALADRPAVPAAGGDDRPHLALAG